MNWSSPLTNAKVLDAAEIMKWQVAGIVVLESFQQAKFDWSILSGKRSKRWPQLIYFLAKLSWWIFLCLHVLMIKSENKIDCQLLAYAVETAMAFVNVSASILLACRVVCLFRGRAHFVVSTSLIVASVGLTAIWFLGVRDIIAVWNPEGGSIYNTEGGCQPVKVTKEFAWKFIYTVIFDFFILLTTTVGVIRIRGTSRLGSLLFSQGIFYFSLVSAVNLVTLVVVLLQLSPLMSIAGAVPSAGISVFASTRLFCDLALTAIPNNHTIELSQRSSKSSIMEKINSFLPSKRDKSSQTLSNETSQQSGIPYTPRMVHSLPFCQESQGPTSSPQESLKGSSSDLESQVHSTYSGQIRGHPYSSPPSSPSPRRIPIPSTSILLESSGLPAFNSTAVSSPIQNHQTTPTQLEIKIERVQDVRSEIVPRSFNFVSSPASTEVEEEYRHLGQSKR